MLTDIHGDEVHEGDTIALALRYGNRALLATYKIVSIGETRRCHYGGCETPVRAEQLTEAGHVSRNIKQSILQGELFAGRALLIK